MIIPYLFLLALFHGANSQADCVPDPVEWIQLDSDYRLSWSESSNCDNVKYIIYMSPVDGAVTNIFETLFTRTYVRLLPMCEMFRFRIVVVQRDTDIASRETAFETKVPAEPGTNVTVARISAAPQTINSVFLEWELDPKYAHCVQFFRVVHWDGESVPVDTYTTYDNVILDELAPCTTFEFTVTPIYNTEAEGGIGYITYETPAHNLHSPTLLEVRPGTTFIDMTWGLPPYAVNRCTISSFIVDGSPFTNLTIPIIDSVSRPNVGIHVDSLQPDRMYFFRVSVVNSAGASQPIQIGIQTLPAAALSNK